MRRQRWRASAHAPGGGALGRRVAVPTAPEHQPCSRTAASGLAEIVRGDVCYRLPLTAEAAACLAVALLADSPADRLHWLGHGLALDPPLALWCAVQAPSGARRTARRALCRWLDRRLHGESCSDAPGGRPIAQRRTGLDLHELLARSRRVAGGVRSSRQRRGYRFDRAAASRRSIGCGWPRPDVPIRDAARAMLPLWLASPLAQIESSDEFAPDSSVGRVRTAIAATAGGSARPLPGRLGKSLFPWRPDR